MNNSNSTQDKIQYPKNLNEYNFSIADLMFSLAKNIRLILAIPLIICLITAMYVQFISKPVYISESKILSSSKVGGGISQAAGIAAQFGISVPINQSEHNWAYPEIIKSRILSKQVLKRKFDTIEFGLQKKLLQILIHGNDHSQLKNSTLESLAVEKLLRMISASEDKLTGIITLKVQAREPNLAANINEAIIQELDGHQRDYNKLKTSKTRQFIEERIVETEKELQGVEDDLKNFMDRNRRIDNSPALQLEQQRFEREVTVLTGVFTTLKQQLETTKIEEVKDSEYVIILDPPAAPLKPSKPRKSLLVVLSGIFGLSLGLIITFINEFASKSSKKDKAKIAEAKSLFYKNILFNFSKK